MAIRPARHVLQTSLAPPAQQQAPLLPQGHGLRLLEPRATSEHHPCPGHEQTAQASPRQARRRRDMGRRAAPPPRNFIERRSRNKV
eukprot:5340464-Pyramimonas_sp.AAC.1